MVLGVVTALAFGGLVVYAIISHGYGWVLRSDGQHYYRVATDPFGNGSAFAGAQPGAGTAYRYGRILYPLGAWILALGNPDWVRYSLPLVYVCGVWLAATLACELCRLAGKPAIHGLFSLAVPGTFVISPILVPELFITGLILLVYRFVLANRVRDAQITAAFLLLARETAVLAVIPLALASLMNRRYVVALRWAGTGIPLALWWGWVRLRVGLWPFLDPVNSYNRPLDLPFRGFLAMIWHSGADTSLVIASLAGWLTIATALWVLIVVRSFPIASGAAWMASLIVFFGPGQATLPGEAFRLMMPVQILIVLAFLTQPSSRTSRTTGSPASARGGRTSL